MDKLPEIHLKDWLYNNVPSHLKPKTMQDRDELKILCLSFEFKRAIAETMNESDANAFSAMQQYLDKTSYASCKNEAYACMPGEQFQAITWAVMELLQEIEKCNKSEHRMDKMKRILSCFLYGYRHTKGANRNACAHPENEINNTHTHKRYTIEEFLSFADSIAKHAALETIIA